MKRKLLILIFTLFICQSDKSIAQITFQNVNNETSFGHGFSVLQTYDSGFVVAGGSQIGGTFEICLRKCDSIGNAIWSKSYRRNIWIPGMAEACQQTPDSGFIIAGGTTDNGFSNSFLIKTNSIGDTIWTRVFVSGSTYQIRTFSVDQTNDGGYILAGSAFTSNSYDIHLIKTDSLGNLVWSTTFGRNYNDYCFSVKQTNDGGYIATGATTNTAAGSEDVLLFKTDSAGNFVWTKRYGSIGADVGRSVLQASDGGFIIAGSTRSYGAGDADIFLIRTDSNGDVLWTKTFGGVEFDDGFTIVPTMDGGFAVVGRTRSFGMGDKDVYLVKLDSSGNELWSRAYGSAGSDEGYSVAENRDGSFILSGNTNLIGSVRTYMVKTDTVGDSECNFANAATVVTSPTTVQTSIVVNIIPVSYTTSSMNVTVDTVPLSTLICSSGDTVGVDELVSDKLFCVFPNPSSEEFTISFAQIIENGFVELYNVYGKKVLTEKIRNEIRKEIKPVAISSGVYFLKVYDGEKSACNKLIIKRN